MLIDRCQPISAILFLILLIPILSFNQIANADNINYIIINEIMYDPIQYDYYNEWIELYNPTNRYINVSGWSISDNYAEDYLEGDYDHGNGTTVIPPNGYAIIADHGTKIYENFSIPITAIRLYVGDYSIGNGLSNTQDKLILKDNIGTVIDAMEWGYDYSNIPGSPATLVEEGHSLARYQNVDKNDSSIDFYEGIPPTPGTINSVVPIINIETCPSFIPKIPCNIEYSIPFAIKIKVNGFIPNRSYQIKTYVTGDNNSTSAATQTWDGETWSYSYYYTNITTNSEDGNWSDWMYLRFKKDYQEYQKSIEGNDTAYLRIKIKRDNISHEISKKVYLLDMDKSTSNGTVGGYTVGIAKINGTVIENKIVIVENETGDITGIYLTEDNEIDDNLISKPGYYKVPSPVASGYKIKILDNNGSLLYSIKNVTIKQGTFGVEITCPESHYLVKQNETLDILLSVKNSGDFSEYINISSSNITEGWNLSSGQEIVFLKSGETYNKTLYVTPYQHECPKSIKITILATSEADAGEWDSTTIQIDLLGADMIITNITCSDEKGKKSVVFGEGEIMKIKASIKNQGNQNTTGFNVTFYHIYKGNKYYIGNKHYDSISKYQKYPSIEWDTKNVEIGAHTILVIVDENNQIEELNETNNECSLQVEIYKTYDNIGKSVLITELYYYTHTKINNEFITIYNPTDSYLNISGWYLTDEPQKKQCDQTKIIFPDKTTIFPKTSICITQNASAFYMEVGKKPDFEYYVDSDESVPQMGTQKTLRLSNNGGAVSLKDRYNHTIDVIVYGGINDRYIGWNGSPVQKSGEGVILKRNFVDSSPIDTNTSGDWIHPRRYGIGQSDFSYCDIPFTGEITTFVSPDCSFKAIADELKKANDSIYFNIYEFTNPFLCDELVAALERNVSVYMFLEGSPIGGIDNREKAILNKIKDNGGKIRFIVNDPDNKIYARYTFDHGKYLIIDNKTTIIESCNWAKTGVPSDPTFGNREWGIIIRNEKVAHYFLNVFLDDWNPRRRDSYAYDKLNLSIPSDFYLDKNIYKGIYKPLFQPKAFIGNFTATPVLSPDTSEKAICNLIESANNTIHIEQLYIYRDWDKKISPFVEKLVNKSEQGIKIKIILNYNPNYEDTNEKCNQTKQYLEKNGIKVKFIYTNWSYFTNIHNKGIVVDNRSVLISSINWNENSVTKNREVGIIIENDKVAQYYENVFSYDWNLKPYRPHKQEISLAEYKNPFLIVCIYSITFAIIAHDWRRREWT